MKLAADSESEHSTTVDSIDLIGYNRPLKFWGSGSDLRRTRVAPTSVTRVAFGEVIASSAIKAASGRRFPVSLSH